MGRAALVAVVVAAVSAIGGYAVGSEKAENRTRTEMSAAAAKDLEAATAELSKRDSAPAACGRILIDARDFPAAQHQYTLELYDRAQTEFINYFGLGVAGAADEAEARIRTWNDSAEATEGIVV
jgi:hypothetical protein